jgi:hypothetical protein
MLFLISKPFNNNLYNIFINKIIKKKKKKKKKEG